MTVRPAAPATGAPRGAPAGALAVAVAVAARRLAAAGVPSPRVDAELLAAHVTGRTRGQLAAAVLTGAPLPAAEAGVLAGLVDRRAARVPLQHLTGTAWFRGVELAVGPGVFIPRPETELLAGWAVAAARSAAAGSADAPLVLDLCTGSGAVAAAVAQEVPGARVLAVELDPAAVGWAARNLAGRGVELVAGDATALDGDRPELAGAVDVVVANPPYIPLGAWESVAPEVRDHDPAAALWGGASGLDTIAGIARCAAVLLRPGGVVGVEHADAQGGEVPALFAAAGTWSGVVDHVDLAGRPRFTTARRLAGRAGSGTIQR